MPPIPAGLSIRRSSRTRARPVSTVIGSSASSRSITDLEIDENRFVRNTDLNNTSGRRQGDVELVVRERSHRTTGRELHAQSGGIQRLVLFFARYHRSPGIFRQRPLPDRTALGGLRIAGRFLYQESRRGPAVQRLGSEDRQGGCGDSRPRRRTPSARSTASPTAVIRFRAGTLFNGEVVRSGLQRELGRGR